MINLSEKTVEVAKTSLEINLQLFGEDEEPGIEEVTGIEEEVDISETEEPETDTGAEPEPAKPEQSKEENAQFAAARREAEKQAKELKIRQDSFAQKYGYQSFEELEEVQRQQEIEAQREAYRNAGIDPDALDQAINNHPAVRQAAEIANNARINSEMAALSSKPFFKELETDIRQTLSVNPLLSAEDVYTYVRGVKADALFSSARSQTEKRTIANIADRKSRGLTDTTDNNLSEDIDLSEEGLEMTRAFGNDPKKIKSHIKKIRS